MTTVRTILLAGIGAAGLYGQADWPSYGHDAAGQRYSQLAQINRKNVSTLKLAWQYGIDPRFIDLSAATRALTSTEAVPIMAGGILYTPTVHRSIVALEPETGKELWRYELDRAAAPLRGVTYWQGDQQSPAEILAGLSDGRLIAVNAKTGKLVPGFGKEGTVNLRAGVADRFPNAPYHMATPGVIYRNLIITGAQGKEDDAEGPAMDVRAWDLRTGKLVWTFSDPASGGTGLRNVAEGLLVDRGNARQLGRRDCGRTARPDFSPIGQPAAQYYGGARHGLNVYSSSIVALDGNTGRVRWSFQLTHHDVWDYDAEAAPSLMEVTRDGKRIR